MRDNNRGYGVYLAAALVFGIVVWILWQAVKWLGIPIGLALAIFSVYQLWQSKNDRNAFTDFATKYEISFDQLRASCGAALAVGVALLVGSVAIHRYESRVAAGDRAGSGLSAGSKTTPEEDEAIKSIVNGCLDGWRDRYLSYEDCKNGKPFGS